MMHWLFVVTLLFHWALPLQADGLEDRALQFLRLLKAGQFDEATQQFDETMLQALPSERLAAVWQQTVTNYGALQSTGEITTQQSGEYTAVIIRSQFERAELNVRVVFDSQGRVAGLFFVPVEITSQATPAVIAAFLISGIFVVLLPIVLAVIARRRLRAPWKLFFFGMVIFIVFQLLTRIPLISVIGLAYGAQISASRVLSIIWVIILSFSAGLFEEFGRLLGYRFLFQPKERTWPGAVMYGLGHGGIEAIVLVGISQLSAAVLMLFAPQLSSRMPADQSSSLLAQVAQAVQTPAWLPFLGAFERVAAIALHVALSVMVLQVFRRGSARWVWLAIGLHGLANTIIAGFPIIFNMPTSTSRIFSTVMLAVTGLAALWIIRRLREADAPVTEAPAALS